MNTTHENILRERRQAIVDAHIDAENRRDVEATIATFHHPRYEVNGEVSDGAGAVRDLVGELLGAASEFHAQPLALYHTADAVIGEAQISGTHDGQFMGIPATGRRFSHTCACIFDFDEDRLLCEKVYFDFGTFLGQIGVLPGSDQAPESDASGEATPSVVEGGPISDAAMAAVDAGLDAHNRRDAAAFAALWTEDGVLRVVAGNEVHEGRDRIEAAVAARYRAFPDWTIERRRIYECGEIAWLESVISGTHEGELQGIPATHRRVELPACSKFRFAPDGRAVEEDVYFDSASLLTQLGLLPAPGEEAA